MNNNHQNLVDVNTSGENAQKVSGDITAHSEDKSVLNEKKMPDELQSIVGLAEELLIFRSDMDTPRDAFELAEEFVEYKQQYIAKHSDTRNEWERVNDKVKESITPWWETTKIG